MIEQSKHTSILSVENDTEYLESWASYTQSFSNVQMKFNRFKELAIDHLFQILTNE